MLEVLRTKQAKDRAEAGQAWFEPTDLPRGYSWESAVYLNPRQPIILCNVDHELLVGSSMVLA